MLSGCRGGGGQTIPAPPDLPSTNLNVGGGAANVDTNSLFNAISGEGRRWISLVDNDNGYIPIRGMRALSEDISSKLPNPEPLSTLTTRFSTISYLQTRLGVQQDPGRYLIWGNQSDHLLPNISLSYDVNGQWTCVGCNNQGSVRHGHLLGQLFLDPAHDNADLMLNGDGLKIRAALSLDHHNTLSSRLLPIELQLDGASLTPVRSDILGSVFGDKHQEAGIVFGIADDQGRVISGGATGHLNSQEVP